LVYWDGKVVRKAFDGRDEACPFRELWRCRSIREGGRR
jgi:hypothetical protein